jgi:hypothetical protein
MRLARWSWFTIPQVVLALSGCAIALPPTGSFNNTITDQDPGWQAFKLDAVTIEHMIGLSEPQKDNAKALLRRLADHSKSLNQYAAAIAKAQSHNARTDAAYSWLNGVIGGLGALLAAVDSKRDWGPVAGGVGAVWTGVGLTLQKAFVSPKLNDATDVTQSLGDVRGLMLAVRDRWEELVNANAETVQQKYEAWSKAAVAADNAATSVLGIQPILLDVQH